MVAAMRSTTASGGGMGGAVEGRSGPPFISRSFSLSASMPSLAHPGGHGSSGASASGSGASKRQASDDLDPSKMDSASLQDVIHYAGIDLKEEAENILREQQEGSDGWKQYSVIVEDLRSKADHYFNMKSLKNTAKLIAQRYGLQSIDDEVYAVVLFGLQKRLTELMDKLVTASLHRVDAVRARFQIKVENDPRKQLWVLENYEATGGEKKDSPVSAEDPKGKAASTSSSSSTTTTGATGANATNTTTTTTTSTTTTTTTITTTSIAPTADSTDSKQKKPRKAAKPVEREDMAVKTKLANVTALEALGFQQKSWMTSQPLPSSFSTHSSSAGGGGGESMLGQEKRMGPSHGSKWSSPYAAVGEKDYMQRILTRSITMDDLLFVMESDMGLSRSTVLMQQLM